MPSGVLGSGNECAKSESLGSCPAVAGACREEGEERHAQRGRPWDQVLEPAVAFGLYREAVDGCRSAFSWEVSWSDLLVFWKEPGCSPVR